MRVSGILLLLLAWLAVQIPWFTCHSDCRDACRPIWDLAAHHCHEEKADEGGGAPRCRCHQHRHDAPEEPLEDEDHGRGDHAILSALAPCPPTPTTYDVGGNVLLVAASLATDGLAAPTGALLGRPFPGRLDTGPPLGLATVRLLL